ncbi:sodium-dependent phosphate transport protein 2B-like [Glandiceps talaboti]
MSMDGETSEDKTEIIRNGMNGTVVAVDKVEDGKEIKSKAEEDEDPWSVAAVYTDDRPKWSELSLGGKLKRVLWEWIGKLCLVFVALYFFVVALNVMGDAFTLIGGSAASTALSDSTILENPITGLMIGVLITVILQSSSATTSIIVSMVASNIIQVQEAIPMVMGANIGTSITNTIVSGGQVNNRDEFRLSFAGATVHDCFNWLTVAIFLPLEMATGYLYHLTGAMVDASNLEGIAYTKRSKIVSPICDLIIQVDTGVLERIALGEIQPGEESLVKRWCETEDVYYTVNETKYDFINGTNYTYLEETDVYNYTIYIERCKHIFAYSELSDELIGLILLIFSLFLLMCCLISLVKILQSMLKGSTANVIMKFLNASFPGYLSWLTGYVAILIGMIFTLLLQSSSVFTSMITPLVGMKIITLERMYPLTLGSNLGTTCTSLLAAFASHGSVDFVEGVQISFCHLFFNLSGIIVWYPIPKFRKPPIGGAKYLGNTVAEYRWFSLAYLIIVFICLPLTVLALSFAGSEWVYLFTVIVLSIIFIVAVINILQAKCPRCLPKFMRTWEFLPLWMRSLEPYDRLVIWCGIGCGKCTAKCCKCCNHTEDLESAGKDKCIEDSGRTSKEFEMVVTDCLEGQSNPNCEDNVTIEGYKNLAYENEETDKHKHTNNIM